MSSSSMCNAAVLTPPISALRPPTRPGIILAWWGVLGILLLAEVLFLTLRFDTSGFAARTDPASYIIAATPAVLRVAIGTSTVWLMLVVWRLRRRFGCVCREIGLVKGGWPWLLAQLASFALLTGITARVLDTATPAESLEILSWMAVAICSGSFWVAAAVPLRFWPGLIRNGRGVLFTGAGIGLGGWAIGRLAQFAWQSSAAPTFWLAEGILRLVYSEVISDPERFVVGTPLFRVRIAPACSGYEGVCLVCLYLGMYLIAFRRTLRFARAVWLIPAGGLIAWSLNVLRIAALVMIGDSGSPALALGGFHSQAGWLAFNVVALGLTFIAQRSHLFATVPTHAEAGPNPAVVYLVPFLTIIAARMLTEALFSGSPVIDSLRVAAGVMVLVYFHRSIRSLLRREDSEVEGWGLKGAVLIGVGVCGFWIALNWSAPVDEGWSDPRTPLCGSEEWQSVVFLVFRVAGSVLIAPLAEELAFRGYLLRRLIAADVERVSPRRFTWASFLISSVLFGLLHENWLAGTLAGMAYAAALYRRGRLSDCVLAHAVTNGLLIVTALATGNWSFWS